MTTPDPATLAAVEATILYAVIDCIRSVTYSALDSAYRTVGLPGSFAYVDAAARFTLSLSANAKRHSREAARVLLASDTLAAIRPELYDLASALDSLAPVDECPPWLEMLDRAGRDKKLMEVFHTGDHDAVSNMTFDADLPMYIEGIARRATIGLISIAGKVASR